VIVLPCKQGGSEWLKARLGIPTASSFDKILTSSTMKASTQAPGYMQELLAEWLIGVPSNNEASGFMDRGTRLEPQARSWYSFDRDVDVKEVGVVLRDDRMVGSSPDGLVGEEGTLEIKTHSAKVHVGHLLNGMEPGGYFAQIQGALWLTGRKWTDLLAYHPDLPPVVVRVARSEAYIAALNVAVSTFVEHMQRARTRLIEMGCQPATRLMIPPSMVNEDPW
jgi:hypothetical protein